MLFDPYFSKNVTLDNVKSFTKAIVSNVFDIKHDSRAASDALPPPIWWTHLLHVKLSPGKSQSTQSHMYNRLTSDMRWWHGGGVDQDTKYPTRTIRPERWCTLADVIIHWSGKWITPLHHANQESASRIVPVWTSPLSFKWIESDDIHKQVAPRPHWLPLHCEEESAMWELWFGAQSGND